MLQAKWDGIFSVQCKIGCQLTAKKNCHSLLTVSSETVLFKKYIHLLRSPKSYDKCNFDSEGVRKFNRYFQNVETQHFKCLKLHSGLKPETLLVLAYKKNQISEVKVRELHSESFCIIDFTLLCVEK